MLRSGLREVEWVVLSNLAYLSQCACKQLTGSDVDVIAVDLGGNLPLTAPRVLYLAVPRRRNLKAWLAFRYSAIVSAN